MPNRMETNAINTLLSVNWISLAHNCIVYENRMINTILFPFIFSVDCDHRRRHNLKTFVIVNKPDGDKDVKRGTISRPAKRNLNQDPQRT